MTKKYSQIKVIDGRLVMIERPIIAKSFLRSLRKPTSVITLKPPKDHSGDAELASMIRKQLNKVTQQITSKVTQKIQEIRDTVLINTNGLILRKPS